MSEWQPIETAPKRGDISVLVFSEKGIEIGRWCGPDQSEPDSCETWCDSGGTATHWMPLPEPPA